MRDDVLRDGQLRSAFTAILERLCESCIGALAAGLVDEEGESVDHAVIVVPRDTAPSAAANYVRATGHLGEQRGPEGHGVDGHALEPDDDLVMMQAYVVKLAGAYWQIVMRQAATCRLGAVRELWVQADQYAYVVVTLHEGYVMTIVLRPDTLASVSRRALRQAEVELSIEAAWPLRDRTAPFWRRVRVRTAAAGQPEAFQALDDPTRQWRPVRGAQPVPEAPFERAFRVHAVEDHLPPQGGPRQFPPQGQRRGVETADKEPGITMILVREASGHWYAALPLPERAMRRRRMSSMI
jgi:hypothetical protein